MKKVDAETRERIRERREKKMQLFSAPSDINGSPDGFRGPRGTSDVRRSTPQLMKDNTVNIFTTQIPMGYANKKVKSQAGKIEQGKK